MLTVAILAGGLATRLRPITQAIPKVLIKVAGKPFICHQLNYLRAQGIHSVVLCIGYLGEMIKDVVGDGSRWDMHVSYSQDGPDLLGTGGAIRQALPILGEHFFILYGDSYLSINFSDVEKAYLSSAKNGLMTVLKNQDQWDRSNVEFSAGLIVEYNKITQRPQMHHIDYGLGILKQSTFGAYPLGYHFDLAMVYNKLSLTGDLAGYEVFDRFYEIGSRQGIIETNKYLLESATKDGL